MQQRIIIHYDEIALKGGNKAFFEKRLICDIQRKIRKHKLSSLARIKKLYGRIRIDVDELTDKQKETWIHILSHTFGIANFSFGIEMEQDLDLIGEYCVKEFAGYNEKIENFKIQAQRSNKLFSKTSTEIEREIGAKIVEKYNKKVKLKDPDLTIFIEIIDNSAFVYTEKHKGLGGLPQGSLGKAFVLISGGFDSPVAAYYAMKRGLSVRLVHFHAEPFVSSASTEKVRDIYKVLSKYQADLRLYECAFGPVQKKLLMLVPEKYRIIFYRRYMFKIAEKLSRKYRVKSLVTGESLGQVASQTIENMTATSDAIKKIILLRPLIGFDKKEIIKKAEEIGTAEISARPHEDCCTLFMPKSPEIKAKMEEVWAIEEKLPSNDLVFEGMKATEKFEE